MPSPSSPSSSISVKHLLSSKLPRRGAVVMHLSLTLSVSLTGPVVYKRYILDLMAGMCQKVKWKKSSLAKEDCTCSPARERRELILAVVCIVAAALFSVVANQYGTERWRKALGVMDIVLNKNPTYVLESIIGDAGGWREQPGPKGIYSLSVLWTSGDRSTLTWRNASPSSVEDHAPGNPPTRARRWCPTVSIRQVT